MKQFSSLAKPIFLLSLITTISLVSPIFNSTATAKQSMLFQDPSQNEQQDKQQKELEKINKELKEKALRVLDEVISESYNLRIPSNRVRMQVAAAETLWKYDQKRALALMIEAVGVLNEDLRINQASEEGSEEGNDSFGLRQEIISRISYLDPKFAYEVIVAMKQAVGQPTDAIANQLDQMELTVASQLVAQDPKKVVQIIENALNKDVSPATIGLIQQINSKEPTLASKLAVDMIKKVQSLDLTSPQNLSVVSYLFSQTTTKSSTKSKPDEQRDYLIAIDEQSRRDLINIIAKAVANEKASLSSAYWIKEYLSLIQNNMSEFERYARNQLPSIKSKITDYNKVFGKEEKYDYEFFQELYNLATVDEMVAKAEQAPANAKQNAYQIAISQAISKGEIDKARQLIEQKIADPTQRKYLEEQIKYQNLNKAATEGKVEEAKRIASEIRSKDERISTLTNLANTALASKDIKTAMALVSEAKNLIGAKAENPNQLRALIQIAYITSTINPQEGFALYSLIIDQTNKILIATLELDGFNPYGARIKDGEFILGGNYYLSYPEECATSLSELAKTNFDLSLSTINRIYLPEMKIEAKMRLIQTLLTSLENETPTESEVPPATESE